MRDLTFRRATPGDLEPLHALVESAYRGASSRQGWTHEADIITSGNRIDDATLLAKIANPDGRVLLAVETGPGDAERIVGCCEAVRQGADEEGRPLALFGMFAVVPGLQNGGIGRRLLGEAERVARVEMGVVVMEMHCLWMREELNAWYGRRGYEVVEGVTRPFPVELLKEGGSTFGREDLYFLVLRKDLV